MTIALINEYICDAGTRHVTDMWRSYVCDVGTWHVADMWRLYIYVL